MIKKKIYFINEYFTPDLAATGQLLNELTKQIESNKFKVIVLTGMPTYVNKDLIAKKYEDSRRRTIIRLAKNNYWPFKNGKKFINGILFSIKSAIYLIFKLRKNDLIFYTSAPPYLSFIAYLVSIFKKNKFIIILYDLYPHILINLKILSKSSFLVKLWESLNLLAFRKSKALIVLSEEMKEYLYNHYSRLSGKVKVITSWANAEEIKPLPRIKNCFIKKHKLESKFVVLYSGNQGRCHDFDTILNASLFLKDKKDIVFLFIGNGFKHKIIKDFKDLHNLNNIKLLPYQDKKDLKFSLASANLALVSIDYNFESLITPSKIYGHLSIGTPIALICNSNSFISKLIKNNNLGKQINIGDYKQLINFILQLKNSEELINKYNKNCRNYLLRNASLKVISKKYLELIEAL